MNDVFVSIRDIHCLGSFCVIDEVGYLMDCIDPSCPSLFLDNVDIAELMYKKGNTKTMHNSVYLAVFQFEKPMMLANNQYPCCILGFDQGARKFHRSCD